jgi:putative peptidoglycan lipid II flippase
MAATLGSTLLGFSREVVSATYYGTRWEMDTFLAAAVVPTILFGVFNGALVSALVPAFSEYLTHRRDEEAWRLANTVINGLFLILAVCAVLGYVLAPWFVPIIAHGFPPPQMGVAIHMTRWLMPSIIAVSLSGVFTAILNAHHRFRSAALTGIVLNITTISTVMFLNQRLGIFALVIGTSLGLIAQMLIQIPALLYMGKYRLMLDLRHPGLRRIGQVLSPIVVGSAAGQTALFFDRYFASTLSPGYIAGMNYVTKLVNFPQQIFAAAIATVIFPLLAAEFAKANRAGIGQSVATGLRLVNFIMIPAMCALLVLARPIVQTLFERGTFGPTATDLCAGLLPYAAVGMIALAGNVVLTRVCFACRETNWAVVVSVVAVTINVALCVAWLPTLGARGLLLANSLSQAIQAALLLGVVVRIVHGVDWAKLLISTLKIVVASAIMVGALHWIQALGVEPSHAFASRAWFLFGQIAIGALVFVAVARILEVEELSLAVRLILQKFERNVPSAPDSGGAPIA